MWCVHGSFLLHSSRTKWFRSSSEKALQKGPFNWRLWFVSDWTQKYPIFFLTHEFPISEMKWHTIALFRCNQNIEQFQVGLFPSTGTDTSVPNFVWLLIHSVNVLELTNVWCRMSSVVCVCLVATGRLEQLPRIRDGFERAGILPTNSFWENEAAKSKICFDFHKVLFMGRKNHCYFHKKQSSYLVFVREKEQ